MIYTALCIMFWMHAYTLRGEVVGGWALEFPSFLGPVKWERADRRVSFGAQKIQTSKSNKQKYFLKVTDEHSRIRIRIRQSEVRIRGSGSVPKCHGSATLGKCITGGISLLG
jgi:hypothetical protein